MQIIKWNIKKKKKKPEIVVAKSELRAYLITIDRTERTEILNQNLTPVKS